MNLASLDNSVYFVVCGEHLYNGKGEIVLSLFTIWLPDIDVLLRTTK